MSDGWLLDITEDPNGRDVLLWRKDGATGRVAPLREEFRPPFFVDGPADALASLAESLTGQTDVRSVTPVVLAPPLFDRRRHRVLRGRAAGRLPSPPAVVVRPASSPGPGDHGRPHPRAPPARRIGRRRRRPPPV